MRVDNQSQRKHSIQEGVSRRDSGSGDDGYEGGGHGSLECPVVGSVGFRWRRKRRGFVDGSLDEVYVEVEK